MLSATVHVTDKHLRLETLGAVSFFHLNLLTFDVKVGSSFLLTSFSNCLACLHQQFSFIFFLWFLSLLKILHFQKISTLAENTSSKVVFNEVLASAGRDIVTKDISRIRGGWSMQDAFYVSAILFTARILLL